MKNFKLFLNIFLLTFIITCKAQNNKVNDLTPGFNERQLLSEWKIKSSTQVTEKGNDISTLNFEPVKWTNAHVPTTVLRALVKEGIYPDPHLDLNNFLIPDASNELNEKLDLGKYSHLKGISNPFKDPYWFRTEFNVPQNKVGKKVWLNFDGINYRADVWVNGNLVANNKEMVGMFLRFKFDITPYVHADVKNVISVKIHQVDHPGTADPGYQFEVFGPHRGQGKDIFKDVTLKFSAGWDCAPVVRDRNMGIYQDVFLTYTGGVDIIDPYVVTDLRLPDTTNADLSVHVELKNVTDRVQKGILKGSIDLVKEVDFYTYTKTMPGEMKTIYFEKEIEIEPQKTKTVVLDPREFKQLTVRNPYLWWPNGYGDQYLHNLKLSFNERSDVSDAEQITFGIREISDSLKELNGEYGRVFYVNGKRIFSRGGWIQPDMMLDMNKKRMYEEARLLAECNVNMIANEDMPSPPEHLMETYDKYGLLIWETFYQCWRMYPGEKSFEENPQDTELALKNSFDIIKRYRSHPSLVLWTSAVEVTVREEIYVPLRDSVKSMDGTRPWVATSSYGWDVGKLTPYMKADLPTGMTDEGAPDYTWYPHSYYYDMILKVKQQMFRNELGVPSVPTYSSMKKFIFDLGKGEKNEIYPLDKNWAHHGAWDGDGYAYRAYDKAIRSQYGDPASAKDYIRKAQYVNAGSYRAMYEAANHKMWDITTGVMLWKLNSTWPTVLWQLYDWFLNPTSAYYFAKKALEPLHIQLNENDHTVAVINATHKKYDGLTAEVKVFNFELNELWSNEIVFDMEEDRYTNLFTLPALKNLTETYFVKLTLKNKSGKIVSDNFYWLSSSETPDFKDLMSLEQVDLKIDPQVLNEDDSEEYNITIKVANPSDGLAFFNRMMITKGEGGDEVLPTFWSDNYFTLLPGEEKVLTARVAKINLEGKTPVIVLDKEQ
jgi:exo-1,4-beta-D-glucosaminidase